MATRFYLPISGAPSGITPAFDAGWEQTGQATRLNLLRKTKMDVLAALTNMTALTVPITTTQDILGFQLISEPLPANMTISGTISAVVRVFENANTNNVTLALLAKVVSRDGGVSRGTLFSTFNTDTEFALSASAATRIVNAQALTPINAQSGDRIVVELGGHAAGPTAAGSYTMRLGNNAASDFALTSGLTTDLNPWVEFSQDLWSGLSNNYQSPKVGNNMGTGERIR